MIVCIDIGGGTTRIGFSNDKKTFIKVIRFMTKDLFEEEIECLIKEIAAVTNSVEAIIVASAGALDRKKGILISWGQRQSWWGKDIFEALARAFPKTEFFIENDASLAALGEAISGAGKDYSLVGYITLSSGIGGGLVVNKQIIPHSFGIEPGHQIINFFETKTWSCGQKGCFESYASGTAFKQIFGMKPEACTDKNIWNKYGKLVAIGLANLIVLWSPEAIVIGGGVAQKFDKFIGSLIEELANLLPMYVVLPKIKKFQLEEPSLYGCLVYYDSKFHEKSAN